MADILTTAQAVSVYNELLQSLTQPVQLSCTVAAAWALHMQVSGSAGGGCKGTIDAATRGIAKGLAVNGLAQST